MTERERRMLRYEERARKRTKTAIAMAIVANGFGRDDRVAFWTALRARSEAWEAQLWQMRREAGIERWRASYVHPRDLLSHLKIGIDSGISAEV